MGTPLDDRALDTLFREARSQNRWSDRPLPDGALEAIWALAATGPTSANCEPARIVWCVSDAARGRLADLCSGSNAPKVRAAPATAVIGYDLRFYDRLPDLFPHTDARSWFVGDEQKVLDTASRNAALQAAYLMLAARALGFDVGPMAGFDVDGAARAFFPDSSVRPLWLCSIGYGDPEGLQPRLPRLSFQDANSVL